MENNDLHWLAGLLEGEGSFMKPSPSSPNCPIISLQMTDEDIVKRVSLLFNCKYHSSNRGADKGWKTVFLPYAKR